MEKKIKLGVIGIGNMGSAHAKSVVDGKCPDFELVAIADSSDERHTWAKENLGENVKLFSDPEEMLDSGLIEACIVAVPHYDHCRYAIACMQRNIHVLVEKPAGVYTKQVMEMNAEADKHPDLKFAMMFNQRTNHIYRKLHELVHSGKYGQIRRTNWIITNWYRPQCYYDSGAWRATWSGEGGGVLLNQCPHQLDLWQWICGMPKRVHAFLHYGKWHDIEVEDDVTAYVEYENGATGVFITTTGDGKGSNRLEIQMDKARIIAEGDHLDVQEFEMSEPEFSRTNTKPFGSIETFPVEVETDGKNEKHTGVINAWGGAILRGEPMVADGREGINGLTISNAMHLSSWLGKTVDIPFDHELYYEELMKRVATSRRKENVKAVFSDTSESYSGTANGEYKARWNTNW
ncbi:MAG: Gfo/Idh/MocA family oxidoreductase [Oscillospiraceae bacterium]|nr:Gfo/Idh/MocA family oxidoreductase [Oscillospiraceae bacterium]